jgi:uncharacterized protein
MSRRRCISATASKRRSGVKTPTALLALGLALGGCGIAATPSADKTAAVGSPAAPSRAADFPALAGRVVDSASLLTPAEEAGLTAQLTALEQRTSDQLVVVTTPSLGQRTIEQYGLALGNSWHIGQRGKDNGVLLIVAPTERRVRIEVGYGREAILTNARAQQIIDDAILPHFRQSRWHEGIEAGTQAIVATLIAHGNEPRQRRS